MVLLRHRDLCFFVSSLSFNVSKLICFSSVVVQRHSIAWKSGIAIVLAWQESGIDFSQVLNADIERKCWIPGWYWIPGAALASMEGVKLDIIVKLDNRVIWLNCF